MVEWQLVNCNEADDMDEPMSPEDLEYISKILGKSMTSRREICQAVEERRQQEVQILQRVDVRSLCKPQSIKESYSPVSIKDFQGIKEGDTVKLEFGCDITIAKVLLVQDDTSVFIVDINDGKNTVPMILKIETKASMQIDIENNIHKHLKDDYTFETTKAVINGKVYAGVLMDYLGTSLGSPIIRYVNKEKLFKKTLAALENLHKSKILHEDIKPDNILYDLVRQKVNIIDFGGSQFVEYTIPYPYNISTPVYCSPYVNFYELLTGKHFYGNVGQFLPRSLYGQKVTKKSGPNIVVFTSVRAFDDLVSLAYTFINYYIPEFLGNVFMMEFAAADARYFLKYGNRNFSIASELKNATPYEKAYLKALEKFRKVLNHGNRKLFEKSKLSIEILYTLCNLARNYYKITFLDYENEIRPNIPEWLHKFVERLGINRLFQVDISALENEMVGIRAQNDMLQMSREEIAAVVKKYPFFYDPFFAYSN